jgi:hypothetical protein
VVALSPPRVPADVALASLPKMIIPMLLQLLGKCSQVRI